MAMLKMFAQFCPRDRQHSFMTNNKGYYRMFLLIVVNC